MEEIFAHTVSYGNKEGFKDLITKMIFIAQALGHDEKNWVTGKELELLVELARQYYSGIHLDSRESVLEIIKNTSFTGKDKNVYVYRSKLIDKGWLRKVKGGFDLVPFLKTLDMKKAETNIKISINTL